MSNTVPPVALLAAGGRRLGGERAPRLVGQGDSDQPCLQGWPRARRGPHHEPPAVLATAEHPQLYLLTRQALLVHVPAAAGGRDRAIGLQPRWVAQQNPVLKPALLQLQQAGQLLADTVDHLVGGL